VWRGKHKFENAFSSLLIFFFSVPIWFLRRKRKAALEWFLYSTFHRSVRDGTRRRKDSLQPEIG
jgi:hypothetical protein